MLPRHDACFNNDEFLDEKSQVPKLSELSTTPGNGVRLIGCQMTMDVMGIKKEDLIDGIEIGGAATFLEFCQPERSLP